jgi:hypothetical protein
MSAPAPADRRAVADLAGLLAKPDGRRVLHLLAYANRTTAGDWAAGLRRIAATPLPDLRTTRGARVGIWEQEHVGDAPAFVRRTDLQAAEFWSAAERIPPRSPCRRRVVLLGESVARGFYYDPHFNPAMCLQRMLGMGLGEDIEVIDLARIDVDIVPLLTLCKSALLLQPDAMVIWAGNNWHPGAAIAEGRVVGASLRLRQDRRAESFKALMDDTLQSLVTAFTSALASLPTRGVPVVFVIPEFNLADWRDTTTGPALGSASDATRWLDLRDEARLAIAAGDVARAVHLGQRLLELDRGSTPAGYYALADASLLRGDVAEARRLLRLSREVSLWWPLCLSSTTYAAQRRTLVAAAPVCGFQLVDLTARFEADCPASLPDRRIFHDYCHLTEEGIRISTAYIAERLLPLLGGPTIPADRMAALDQHVPGDVLAAANLVAGVYNADNDQSPGVVRHHLSNAVSLHPVGAALIEQFLDFRIRREPAMLCDSLERLIATVPLMGYHLIHGLGRVAHEKLLNLSAIDECVRALGAADPSAPVRIQRLLLAEQGASGRTVDLLERGAALNSFLRRMTRGRVCFYRAFDRTSLFPLICDATRPVTLHLTCRCPESRDPRTVVVRVNGQFVGSFSAAPRWRGESLAVPEGVLRLGTNEVVLEWPAPDWDHERHIDEAIDLLEANIVPDLSPVFGHLAAFSAVMEAPAPPRELELSDATTLGQH